MEELQMFKITRVSDRITRITGVTDELMYLVEGDERAALIDTGIGIGNLKGLVKSLTDKPIIVLLTHGHVDHAMGASEFDDVYMNLKDLDVYAEHSDMKIRKDYIKKMLGEKYNLLKESDFIMPKKINFKPLKPGDIFPLGGITLEIMVGEGHTQGMVTILFKEERALLLGDACNFCTFVFGKYSSTVRRYREVLKQLQKEAGGRYDTVYLSHGDGNSPKEMIESVIEVCDDILNGKTDSEPLEMMGENVYVAKKMKRFGERVDGGIGDIIYSKDKIG